MRVKFLLISATLLGLILIAMLFANKTLFEKNKLFKSEIMKANESNALRNIAKRKSVRSYISEKYVEEEKIEQILRAAMAAPSGKNRQPWEFVVVKNRANLDALATKLPYAKMLSQAPLAIVVCADTTKSSYWYVDCSAATQNLLLAVEALELGAVWTATYPYADRMNAVREVLNLPENIESLCVVPIGYPSGENEPKDKWKPEKIHNETW